MSMTTLKNHATKIIVTVLVLGIIVIGFFMRQTIKEKTTLQSNYEATKTQTYSGQLDTIRENARKLEKRQEEIKLQNEALVKEYDENAVTLSGYYTDSTTIQSLQAKYNK